MKLEESRTHILNANEIPIIKNRLDSLRHADGTSEQRQHNVSTAEQITRGDAQAVDSVYLKPEEVETKDLSHESQSQSYPCPYCPGSMRSSVGLRQHLHYQHGLNEFLCPICLMSCNSLRYWAEHAERCELRQGASSSGRSNHIGAFTTLISNSLPYSVARTQSSINAIQSNKNAGMTSSQGGNGTAQSTNCQFCGRPFPTQKAARKHVRLNHGDKLPVCGWCGSRYTITEELHQSSDCKQRYKCRGCNAIFSKKKDLRKHEVCCPEVTTKKHECYYCKRRFRSASSRSDHIGRCHQEKLPSCTVCGQSGISHTQQHMSKCTGINLVCYGCRAQFCTQAKFNRHQKKCAATRSRASEGISAPQPVYPSNPLPVPFHGQDFHGRVSLRLPSPDGAANIDRNFGKSQARLMNIAADPGSAGRRNVMDVNDIQADRSGKRGLEDIATSLELPDVKRIKLEDGA